MKVQGHLIMAPISELPHQHQSGSYLEELHDLRLCRPPWIKPFITCWHSCPALNACTPWESDEASETWWVTDNLLLCKRWLDCVPPPSARPAVPSRPCQALRLADATISARPSLPGPSHLRWQTAGRREIARSRWGHLLWPAHPSIVSLSHVTYSCFSGLTTLPDRAFQFWVRHKKGRGEEKLTWPLFSERAGTKRRTRLRANKSRAPPQKKLPVHPYGSPQHSRPYKTPWAPKETIKRSVPTHRNVCKESACTKAICNFTKWQT